MLADILAPMSTEEFFGQYWTKQFLHLPGPADKFRALFSWDVLNTTLETHRFTTERLKLVKSGKTLEPSRYVTNDIINASSLMNELSGGATLIFNFCEEVQPALRAFCAHLERLFHVYVHVNLYAGWRKDNGFDIHWDDQDTFILQVAGRKHWKVWKPTRLYPFVEDVVDTSPSTKPEEEPVWDGVLEQGAMLSMPRGWWHVAYPMDEPCLHLTVTIQNLNGISLLRWFTHKMKASEAARKELPIVASREDQQAWLREVWVDMCSTWNENVLDGYLADADGRARSRPRLNLPEIGMAAGIGIDTPLELALPRALHFETSDGNARFKAAGADWNTTSELVPALARFNDGHPHTLSEVAGPNAQSLTLLVTALLMQGVVRRAALREA
jgi:ribosomal protein L16 Arg81 hydroxylase